VSVFEGKFRITEDLKKFRGGISNSLGTDGKIFSVAGKLDYQACDSKICYLPTSVPSIGRCKSCLSIGRELQRLSAQVERRLCLDLNVTGGSVSEIGVRFQGSH